MNYHSIFWACNNLLHIKAAVTLSYQLDFLLNNPSQFELNGEFDDRQVSAGPHSDIGRVGQVLHYRAILPGSCKRATQYPKFHWVNTLVDGHIGAALKHHFVAHNHILTPMFASYGNLIQNLL